MASSAQVYRYAGPASVAAGTAIAVLNWRQCTLYPVTTYVATADVQISSDAVAWFNFLTGVLVSTLPQNILGPGVSDATTYPGLAKFFRMNVTAYTSGTPTFDLVYKEW